MNKKNSNNKYKFTFIDLFAGIGGFHIAMSELGGKCVFGCDIDKNAAETYKQNFGMNILSDIKKINIKEIPTHDVLCAGFPCQSFSNAGKKRGFSDIRGTLFFDIVKIIQIHHPKYIFLENVKHLVRHDNGRTWNTIKQTLIDLGYILPEKEIISSPHEIGIPQNRPRIYIMGIRKDLINDKFLKINLPICNKISSIYDILNKEVDSKYTITQYESEILLAWDVFKRNIHKNVFGFPIWVDEFEKNYDISSFPKWKQEYITKNRQLYSENKKFIDEWLAKYNVKIFKKRDRKFEWQAGDSAESVWDTSIQLRQSGIRCKKTNYFPALVAMVQIPIIGKYKRRLTPREVARLQSFPESFIINNNDFFAYKQFGNSLNIEIVKYYAKQLLNYKLLENDKNEKRK